MRLVISFALLLALAPPALAEDKAETPEALARSIADLRAALVRE